MNDHPSTRGPARRGAGWRTSLAAGAVLLTTMTPALVEANIITLDPFTVDPGQISNISAQQVWRAQEADSGIVSSSGGSLAAADPYVLQLRFDSGDIIRLSETGAVGDTVLSVNPRNLSSTVSHPGATFSVQLTDHAGGTISPVFQRVLDFNSNTSLAFGIVLSGLLGVGDFIDVGGLNFSIGTSTALGSNVDVGNIGLVADTVTFIPGNVNVPEPVTLWLLGLGLLPLALRARRVA